MIKVSVIIAAWNAAGTLNMCIESLLAQEHISQEEIEVLVVDDCSTDETWALLQHWQSRCPNLRPLQTTENSGPSVARNLAIAQARGEWIAIIDGDDCIQPNRLVRMISYAASESLDVCFDNIAIRFPEHPEQVSRLFVPPSMAASLKKDWSLAMYASLNMPYKSEVLLGFLKPLIRREFICDSKLAYRAELRNSEDFILILEALIAGARIGYLNEPLYDYFVYKNSLSGRFNKEAHHKLISVEKEIISMANPLSDLDRDMLKKHLESLLLAEETNYLFEMLREQKLLMFFSMLWRYRLNGIVHVRRILNSLSRKMMGVSSRGS